MGDVATALTSIDHNEHSKQVTLTASCSSLAPFGPGNSTHGESDRWVSLYKKKPLLQKIFENKLWVQDATVRLLQDRIVM